MKKEIVKVSSFTGQCYGSEGRPIRITFHDEFGPVDFNKGDSPQHGPYHLDNEDIIKLSNDYQGKIPSIGDQYYDSVIDWGYDVEDQLSTIMVLGLELEREKNNELYLVEFRWVALPWNADRWGVYFLLWLRQNQINTGDLSIKRVHFKLLRIFIF